MLNSPRNIALLLHGLCTWPRIDWILQWRQLSSPKPWQFREVDDERARYLHDHPDYLQWYPVQEETKTVVLSTDAATRRETRRSNSGGTVMLGNHLIAAWSRVQPRIALSSGEAEVVCWHARNFGNSGVRSMREFQVQRLGSDCSSCGRKCLSCHHVETWLWWTQTYHRQISVGSRSCAGVLNCS